MRGLTPLERMLLAAPADYRTMEHETIDSLVAAGRMRRYHGAGVDGADRYLATDLGALALRSCPLEEA